MSSLFSLILDASSAGLHCDGSHAAMTDTPLANMTALILRNTSSSSGREERPLLREYKDTVESSNNIKRVHIADGYDNIQCNANSTALNSS